MVGVGVVGAVPRAASPLLYVGLREAQSPAGPGQQTEPEQQQSGPGRLTDPVLLTDPGHVEVPGLWSKSFKKFNV